MTNPSAAAAHNTTLKLQGLLARPELAANVRAELCPNDLTLGELFHVFSWSKTDRLWKGLGSGAKEPALYNLVRRGLLPESFAVVGVAPGFLFPRHEGDREISYYIKQI